MSMEGVQARGVRRRAERREPEGVPGLFSTQLTCFLLGGAVGAIAALLFAPKSGRELRADIADATRKGVDTARERAGEYYEGARERAGELYSTAAERATSVAASAREAAARRSEGLSAAIEAGKRAYADEKRRTESSAIMEPAPNYEENG
jgi:gas vesicle protein